METTRFWNAQDFNGYFNHFQIDRLHTAARLSTETFMFGDPTTTVRYTSDAIDVSRISFGTFILICGHFNL